MNVPFLIFFLNLYQLPAAKTDMQKLSITTNVWPFLFCQSFNPIPTRLCHVIYCHGDKSYACLVEIWLIKS